MIICSCWPSEEPARRQSAHPRPHVGRQARALQPSRGCLSNVPPRPSQGVGPRRQACAPTPLPAGCPRQHTRSSVRAERQSPWRSRGSPLLSCVLRSNILPQPFARGAYLRSDEPPLPLPSMPLVRGDIPMRPSARGANLLGRPAAVACLRQHTRTAVRAGQRSLRPSCVRARGALISAATGLRSPSPHRRLSAATHPRCRPRGALISLAVPRPRQLPHPSACPQ